MADIKTLFPAELVKTPFDGNRSADIKIAFQKLLRLKLDKNSTEIKKISPYTPEELETYLENINVQPEVISLIKDSYERITSKNTHVRGRTQEIISNEIKDEMRPLSTYLNQELTPEKLATHQENYPDKNREEGGKLGQFKNSKTPVKYIVDIEPLKKGHEGEETKKYLSETFHKLLRYTNIGSSTPDINKPISRDDLFQYISDMNVLLEVVDLITEAYEKLLETYTNKKNPKRNEIIDMVKEIIIPLDAALQEELTEAKIKEDQELFPDELLIKKNERRFV